MGGTDDPKNLADVTIEEHASLHKQLWEEFGHWEDELAWKGLSKMIDKQEIISQVISNTHKGKKISEETKKKMSEASPWKGKTRSIESRKKMSSAQKGKILSENTKDKLSDALSGKNNPMFGKTHSEEARRKISESRKSQAGKKRGPYKGKTEYSQSHVRVVNRNG